MAHPNRLRELRDDRNSFVDGERFASFGPHRGEGVVRRQIPVVFAGIDSRDQVGGAARRFDAADYREGQQFAVGQH